MESRKLIKFGNSSHVISLPTTWLKKNNLNKGNSIYIKENSNNELILSPDSNQDTKKDKKITISITNKTTDAIRREIISAYVNHSNTIEIIGNNLKEKIKDIREIINNLVALEIMEQSSEKIIAKDFLNIKDLSINKIIREADIITRTILSDTRLSFKKDQTYDIDQKDIDVNRLYFLAYRAIKEALDNPKVSQSLNMTTNQILDNWMLILEIEEIADTSKRVSKFFNSITLTKEEVKKLEEIHESIESYYLEAMKAYYTQNKTLAINIAKNKNEIFSMIKTSFGDHKYKPVGIILEKLLELTSIVHRVIRLIINSEY